MRRAAVICFFAFLFLCHADCGRKHTHRPRVGTDTGVRIAWTAPGVSDSTLADTLRIELSLTGGPAGPVAVRADGVTVAERTRPPWRFAWLPPGDSARAILLDAIACVGDGHENVNAPARIVRWRPNAPPRVEIVGIPAGGGVRRSAQDSLRAIASDPEDGPLAGDAIIWSSDLEGWIGSGDRIPSEALIAGRHILRVRATDRWKRSAVAERPVEVFDTDRDADTPEALLEYLRHAMIAADSAAYVDNLDPDFRFLLCPAELEADSSLPAGWRRAEEVVFAGHLWSITRAEWTLVFLQRTEIGGEAWAKAEVENLIVDLSAGPENILRTAGGKARIYVRKRVSSPGWKLLQWQDLGASEGISYGRLRIEIIKKSGRPVRNN